MDNKEYQRALVFAAKNGNDKCFEELYKLYYQKIYALALTTLKNADDAEDALQLTFITAWQYLSRLENADAFNTWLQRITLNQCYSILRRKRVSLSLDTNDEPLAFDETDEELVLPQLYAERSDLSFRLTGIINELSDVQRQSIMLYYFSELSVEEIAAVMGCSEGTVKSRLFLARKAIKTEIEEQERKSGEKFYGIAGLPVLPFGKIFVAQVKSAVISQGTAAAIFRSIIGRGAGAAAQAASAAQPSAYPNTQTGYPIRQGADVNAAHVAGTTAKTAAKASVLLGKPLIAIISAVVIAVSGTVGTVAYVATHRHSVSQSTTSETATTTETEGVLRDTELGNLEDSLCTFFENYYWGFCEEFDSENPAAYSEMNADDPMYVPSLITGIIGHPNGVDDSLYPVVPSRDLYDESTFDYSESEQKARELGISEVEGSWLMEYDKESVYWIAENVFNLDRDYVTSMIAEHVRAEEVWDRFYEGKGADGRDKYYIVVGGVGGPGFTVDITWARTDGDKYYVRYDLYGYEGTDLGYYNGRYSDNMFGASYYAVLELKSADGKDYWSLYKNSEEIPEDIFSADVPDFFSNYSGRYKRETPMGGSELTIENDGSFSGLYHESVYENESDKTVYYEFSGKFSTPKKVDKYSCSMVIESIEYKRINGYSSDVVAEYDPDGRLEGFEVGKPFIFYYKGTPVPKLPEKCRNNINAFAIETTTGLPFNCLDAVDTSFSYQPDNGE